jgi:transposase
VNEEQVKLLMTMPGVDYHAAMILLSEIGDVKRFPHPREACKLGRLNASGPSIRQISMDGAHNQEGQQESAMDPNPMRPIR